MKRLISSLTLLSLALAVAVAAAGTQAPAPASAGKAVQAQHTGAAPAKATKAMTPKVDINSATKEELMKVPGIGDVTADKIIAGRPFKAKSELVSKGILTKGAYAKIASHIVAKQEKAAATK